MAKSKTYEIALTLCLLHAALLGFTRWMDFGPTHNTPAFNHAFDIVWGDFSSSLAALVDCAVYALARWRSQTVEIDCSYYSRHYPFDSSTIFFAGNVGVWPTWSGLNMMTISQPNIAS